MKRLTKWLPIFLLVLTVGTAHGVVINFDDNPSNPLPNNYSGLTWGTSTDDSVPGNIGAWYAMGDTSYSTPKSSPNYAYNGYGPNNLSFSFPSPVYFNGAWFATLMVASDYRATQVRFRDNLGDTSAWLDLSNTPQFLQAGFIGATTIYVERRGGAGTSFPEFGNARWFAMDDVTYNESQPVPEPSIMVLLGISVISLVGLRRRWKD